MDTDFVTESKKKTSIEEQFVTNDDDDISEAEGQALRYLNNNKNRRVSSAAQAKVLQQNAVQNKKNVSDREQTISDMNMLRISVTDLQKQVIEGNREQEQIVEMFDYLTKRVNELEALLEGKRSNSANSAKVRAKKKSSDSSDSNS